MANKKAIATQDLGLELGLMMAQYLLGAEDLHYGLWTDGLEVKLENLPAAQAAYTELLLSHVPAEPSSILEVGCGAGVTAEKLLEMGHEVECVSPPTDLLKRAIERLGDRAVVHEMGFEGLKTDKKFDLVLFSESFQYVRCREGLTLAKSLLKPGGAILICDFFKRLGKHISPIGGGHKLNHLTEGCENLQLEICEDIDITDQTAPNLDLVNDFMQQVGKPGYEASMKAARRSFPFLTRLARWFFRKRLAKMEYKYFSAQRTGKVFADTKTYRLFKLRPVETGLNKPAESDIKVAAGS